MNFSYALSRLINPKNILPLVFFCWTAGIYSQVSFTDIAPSQNIYYTSQGGLSGLSLADFDGDGWDDLSFTTGNGDSLLFYRNVNGTFQKVIPAFVTDMGQIAQVVWADYDNDNDQDLFITNYNQPFLKTGRSKLFMNDGNMNFTDVTVTAGLSVDSVSSVGATFGDYDRDGYLDLLVLNRDPFQADILYRNLGNGTFQNVTNTSGIGNANLMTFCATFFDYNNDLWPDFYTAEDLCPTNQTVVDSNRLYRNNTDGTFSEVGFATGADICEDAMSVTIGDYNNDANLDIYITNSTFYGGSVLLHNQGNGTFIDVADTMGVLFDSSFNWGSNWLDMENDGDQDLYVACGLNQFLGRAKNKLYENPGDGSPFVDVADLSGMVDDTSANYGSAIGDFNNDGYPDIAVSALFIPGGNWHSPLWQNSGGTNNWIKIDLEGTASNRDGVGCLMEVYAGGKKQIQFSTTVNGFLAQSSQTYIFGLDTNSVVDSVIVHWPSGCVDRILNSVTTIPLNSTLQVLECGGCTSFLALDLGPDTTLCANDSLLLSAMNTGLNPDYVWQDNSSDPDFTVDAAGTYYVEVTVGNCSGSDTIQVQYAAPVQVQLGNDTTVCAGDTLALDATTAGGSYLWQDTSTGASFDVTSPGTFYVEVTVGNCKGSDTLLVQYDPPVLVTLGNDTTLCPGATLLLDATTAGATYRWQDLSTNSTFMVTASGSYYVDVLIGNCSGSDTVQIQYDSQIQVSLGNDTTLCEGDTLILDATTAGASYLWQDASTNALFPVSAAGTYYAEVSIGNCSGADTILVSYFPEILVDLGNDTTLCDGDTLILDVATTGGSYQWQDNSTDSTFLVGAAWTVLCGGCCERLFQ